jgi:molybdenum cofactor biosynthesis enzyme MoaA
MSLKYGARNLGLKAAAAASFPRFSAALLRIRWAELQAAAADIRPSGRAVRLPRSVVLRITERCFLRCRMCGQNGPRGRLRHIPPSGRDVFDPAALARVMEELGRWPVKPFLKITGGEPLVETDLTLRTLERASRQGLATKLSTNGVLLSDAAVARRVVRSGLDFLSVSVDGPADVHDRIRGRAGVYEAALRGIRNVRRFRGAEARRPLMILVSVVVSALNQDRLFETARLMEEAGVDWLNFQFINFTTPALAEASRRIVRNAFGIDEAPWAAFEAPDLAEVDAERLAVEIRAIRRRRFAIPVSFLGIGRLTAGTIADYFHHVEVPLKKRLCPMPRTAAFLVPPRHAAFCIDYPFYRYADLADGPLASAWFGERAEAFRRTLAGYYRNVRANFPHCRRCNWRFN